MPETQTARGSEFNQTSFLGGMNLLGDDSRLQPNQYRAGFDLTNRYDVLDPVLQSELDVAFPVGNVQEVVTFGNYIIAFVSGLSYYRLFSNTGWTPIPGFSMSPEAPRYWTQTVPVAVTNYIRFAVSGTISSGTSDPSGGIELSQVEGAAEGSLPGLLVQDNINQPQFIFLNGSGFPEVRVTQTFDQWHITFTDAGNTVVATDGDQREYVPVGNNMAFDDGILYISSQDGNLIFRSVSGRPLDFVVNVTNTLVDGSTTPPFTQVGGGDAFSTAYSVGVGGITCLRQMSTGGIFVAASNANFLVTKNKAPNAPTEFGEYTFNRQFLFNANCLSDRVIIDTIGDTRFIDLTGVRSFNAIEQTQNEGRNTPFTATIQGAFTGITQSPDSCAAILFDNYELYAMQTIFGPAICKYDTINNCWVSFDLTQTGGKGIKILTRIELAIQRLYAVTTDNKLYTLYIGPSESLASFRSIGVCANILYGDTNIRLPNPKNEIRPLNTRVVLNKITRNCVCSFTPYVNNRLTQAQTINKSITYEAPALLDNSTNKLPDINTQLMNLIFPTPNCAQGWKVFGVFSWTGGSFTQLSMEMEDLTPMNPLNSQELSQ